jgi:hypothetical protein
MVRKPQSPQGRKRILSATEKQALLVTVKPSGRRNVWLEPLEKKLALETAMRRGEEGRASITAIEQYRFEATKSIALGNQKW